MSQTYKIGEAAALLNLKTYVLRFWETEFPQISPLRTDKGQRLYAQEHLEILRKIRFLLHERGLTIDGARRILEEEAAKGTLQNAWDSDAAVTVLAVEEDVTPQNTDANFFNKAGSCSFETGPSVFPPSAEAAPRRKSTPESSDISTVAYKEIIEELEEVAAILRGYQSSGECLQ